ncbi:MAG: DUF222 domain-containing protein [Pseudolysinimonas sp.]
MSEHELLDQVRTCGAASLSGADLLRALDELGQQRRDLDAVAVELSGELETRGPSAEYRTTVDAVAARTGVALDEARMWCLVGAATVAQVSIQGEVLPPRCEAIAAGLRDRSLSITDAAMITRTLDQLVPFTDLARRAEVEAALVAVAPGLTRRDLARAARRIIDHLDPDGTEPREDLIRARAGLRIRRLPDGTTQWIVTFHPEAEGMVTAALDARTAPRRQPTFDSVDDAVDDDPRTLAQRRLDALVDMARESLQHDTGQVAGVPVGMQVTSTLDGLLTGIGTAEIAGVDLPISAATARRLASDAEIIPCVLGGPSEVLDQGRAFRLFTTPQRRAIAVRDGECVWPGCNAPPGWCEVAHLVSWLDGGGTDLDNGVLLCRFHHRRFDNDGWTLEWIESSLWLTPPAHVDATRTPRRAGRLPALV